MTDLTPPPHPGVTWHERTCSECTAAWWSGEEEGDRGTHELFDAMYGDVCPDCRPGVEFRGWSPAPLTTPAPNRAARRAARRRRNRRKA